MNALDQPRHPSGLVVSTNLGQAPMVEAVAERHVMRVYRHLQRVGFSQEKSAAPTSRSQPEVSAIIRGRGLMWPRTVALLVVAATPVEVRHQLITPLPSVPEDL